MAEYYHPDLVRLTFVLGIVVSILFYERRQLTTGGIAVPGYLVLAIFQPIILPAVIFAALGSWLLIHRGLGRLMVLPTSALFSLTILASSALHLVADIVFVGFTSIEESSSFLRGVGYVVPGLIAHDIARHGMGRTLGNIGAATSVVAILVLLVLPIFPELTRLEVSPVADPFPVDLAYLPLLVFLSLVAWLGIVRLHGLRCGGFLGGAYLTLLVLQPEEIVRFLLAALATLLIVRVVLDPIAILFGRRRFAAHMLIGACLSWAGFRVAELHFADETISAVTPSLAVLGVLLTGLLAHDMDRVGISKTLLGGFLSVAYTLSGTLLVLECATYQRLEVAGPLFILFVTGSALLAASTTRLARILARLSGRALETGENTHA